MLNNESGADSRKRESQGGFSLLEMVVALVILTVGLLGVASAIGYALMASNSGRSITNTKLLVVSVLEQMETLRDTGNLTFGQIANAGQVDNTGADTSFAGFPTAFRPVSTNPGPDGIWGTSDDLVAAGPDGVYGTADDVTDQSLAIRGVTRQVTITSLSSTLKRIQVTVSYSANGGSAQQIVGVSYLNDDSHGNYIP
jgi:prepilin-type N-terminal cleavage/methylation domain-containing protein